MFLLLKREDKNNRIRIDVEFIKENMPDKEMFLTTEEERLFEDSFLNEKNGLLVSSDALKRQLGT